MELEFVVVLVRVGEGGAGERDTEGRAEGRGEPDPWWSRNGQRSAAGQQMGERTFGVVGPAGSLPLS